MEKLKPCPFCGSEVELFDNSKDFTADTKRYYIRCKNEKKNCLEIMAFYTNTDKAKTIKAWNKRAEVAE